jgi:16S rRNA (guanine527-N7)-methyltransferase
MPLSTSHLRTLKKWFDERNLSLDRDLVEKISSYQDLILAWSTRINLVSKGDHATIIENHILDSLGPLELIPKTGRLVDIGTGAGFPGIPIALVRPRLQVTLVESIHKKILFLRAAQAVLGLDNIKIIEGRAEKLSPSDKYDIATMRALPHWESHINTIRKMIRPDGKIIYYQKRGIYITVLSQKTFQ